MCSKHVLPINVKTDTISQNKIKYTYTTSNLDFKEIEFSFFQIVENDTILLKVATYRKLNNDPSEFISFIQNENNFEFGIGFFEFSIYFSFISIKKEDDSTEIFTIN